MLAPYGITERMVAAGLICPTWQIRMHPSGERAVFDLAMLAGETDHPYRLQCEQAKYCRFVLAALGALPSVTLAFSTRGHRRAADRRQRCTSMPRRRTASKLSARTM